MKTWMAALAMIVGLNGRLQAQAAPVATANEPHYNPGPSLPAIEGNFQYALTASEVIQSGYYGASGLTYTTDLSGDVEYLGTSAVHPFTMLMPGD